MHYTHDWPVKMAFVGSCGGRLKLMQVAYAPLCLTLWPFSTSHLGRGNTSYFYSNGFFTLDFGTVSMLHKPMRIYKVE